MQKIRANLGGWLVVALLILGGFVFPFLFVLAAVLGWTILNDQLSPPIKSVPPPPDRRLTVTAADPDWKDVFRAMCESPAETAFLEAAVAAWGLTPNVGRLTGSGLTLELQVVERPYRLDFLADKWLVIEIDGDAYHSSEEAKARDAARDEVLRTRGYTVLRIRARVVFDSGAEAVRRVRAALAAGPVSLPPTAKPTLPPAAAAPARDWSLGGTLGAASTFLSDLDRHVTLAAARQKFSAPAKAAFDTEKLVITRAISAAEHDRKIEAFCAEDPQKAELYRDALERIEKVAGPPSDPIIMTVPPIVRPASHPDAEADAAIQRIHQGLVEDREKFLQETRARLRLDPELPARVRQHLETMGCGTTWPLIAP